MNISSIWQLFMAVALVTPMTICFAGTNGSGSSSDNMLLLDSLGRVVAVPTNEVPSELRPATGSGLDRQIPNPTAGSSMPLPQTCTKWLVNTFFRSFARSEPTGARLLTT